jgi:hypothetical protein
MTRPLSRNPSLTLGNHIQCVVRDLPGIRIVVPTPHRHRCFGAAPPPLQPDGRHRHKVMGQRDATPAPISVIVISTGDADTQRPTIAMEPSPPPGLPPFQSAVPCLQFQPTMPQAPISTGRIGAPISTDGGPGSGYNWRCQSSDFNRRRSQI